MPGYMIHLAVGSVYLQNNKIKDIKDFNKGIIEPDMISDKTKSHYGPDSSHPGLNRFIDLNGISSDYKEGYFLHLLTDYLFYNRFLKEWDSNIYNDYNKLNSIIKEKYKIIIPKEIENIVKFKTGKLEVLNEGELYRFIDSVGKLNIREIVLRRNLDYENEFGQIEL